MTNPIGVATYALQSKLPGELKGKLPTAKQLADIRRAGAGGRKVSGAAPSCRASFRNPQSATRFPHI